MSFFEFPSKDDYQKISKVVSFEKILSYIHNYTNKSSSAKSTKDFIKNIELREWVVQLQNRVADVRKSYVMLTYYYNKGIPDKEWYISPGKEGKSIQYYPHFDEVHFYIKDWFDYYSDTFYYKLFSAWDTLGQMLNVKYDLNLKEPSFSRVLKELRKCHNILYAKLTKITNNTVFKEAKKIRNDITHNYLPSSTGIAVTKNKRSVGVGIRDYITSDEISDNVRQVITLFERTVEHILT